MDVFTRACLAELICILRDLITCKLNFRTKSIAQLTQGLSSATAHFADGTRTNSVSLHDVQDMRRLPSGVTCVPIRVGRQVSAIIIYVLHFQLRGFGEVSARAGIHWSRN